MVVQEERWCHCKSFRAAEPCEPSEAAYSLLCTMCRFWQKHSPFPFFFRGKGWWWFCVGFLVLGSCMSELETAALSYLLTPKSGLRGRSQAQGGTPLVKSTVCHIWYQCPSFGSWLHLHPSVQGAGMVNAAVVVAGKERRAGSDPVPIFSPSVSAGVQAQPGAFPSAHGSLLLSVLPQLS